MVTSRTLVWSIALIFLVIGKGSAVNEWMECFACPDDAGGIMLIGSKEQSNKCGGEQNMFCDQYHPQAFVKCLVDRDEQQKITIYKACCKGFKCDVRFTKNLQDQQ